MTRLQCYSMCLCIDVFGRCHTWQSAVGSTLSPCGGRWAVSCGHLVVDSGSRRRAACYLSFLAVARWLSPTAGALLSSTDPPCSMLPAMVVSAHLRLCTMAKGFSVAVAARGFAGPQRSAMTVVPAIFMPCMRCSSIATRQQASIEIGDGCAPISKAC